MNLDSNVKLLSFAVLMVAAAGVGAWWCLRDTAPVEDEVARELVAYQRSIPAGERGSRPRKERVSVPSGVRRASNPKSGASFVISDEVERLAEEELQGISKELMQELRDAARSGDLNRVRKAIARFRLPEEQGGLGGLVPRVLRRQAVASLRSCGSGSISDLAEFLGDGSPEVAEEAISAIKDEISDAELSDQERADLLVTMMAALSDADDISTMMLELNGMKESVKGDALQRILASGTSQAKKIVGSELQIYTEMGVKDAETLAEWTDKARAIESGTDEVVESESGAEATSR